MYYYVTRPNYNPNKKLTIEDILFDLVSEREYYANGRFLRGSQKFRYIL